MLALVLLVALCDSPRSEAVTFDVIEHNSYCVSRYRYPEDAPTQTIFWRAGHVVYWTSGLLDVWHDGEGCFGFVGCTGGTKLVRTKRYVDSWSYDDPEVEDRYLSGEGHRRPPEKW